MNHQHRGRWLGQVQYHQLQTSCCSGAGAVVGAAVALKACGCEPSAQRPVVGSGAVPSAQTSCCSGAGAVGWSSCGIEGLWL